jgi:hypothetical protein
MLVVYGNNQCCVWDRYKYALYTKFREPKLYRYVAEGEWDLIPERCKTHPKEARFVHKYAPMDTALGRLLRTELGAASNQELSSVIFEMKYAAVVALLDANPFSAILRDSFQRTPLHWACMDAAGNHLKDDGSDENSTLRLLLKCAPQAAQMVDMEKRTPLHYLVARNDEIPMQFATMLIALHPESLDMKDAVGETPLDIIRLRNDEIQNADEVATAMQKLQCLLEPSKQQT